MKQRTTLRDIALKIGVSAVTVHKAIYSKKGVGEETRKKILYAAEIMGYSVNEAASSLKRKALHIAVILQNASNPQNFFFRKMWEGIDRAEHGLLDYHVRITRIECGDNWQSQEKILRNIARRGNINGVILHCWDEMKLNPVIDDLHTRGVPVVTVNADAIGSKRVGCVSAPHARVGSLAAEVLGRLMPDVHDKQILVVGGDRLVENLKTNRKSFARYMQNTRPGIAITEIFNLGDRGRFQKDFSETMRSWPDIAGIYAITARDTYNACQTVKNLGLSHRVKIIGSDAFEELKPFFEDGTLDATIWKDPQSQAERAVFLLYQHLSGRAMSVEPVKLGIIMKNNLEDYL
jgi:LacI family transcriptional regulator